MAFLRLLWPLAALAACGTTGDPRPATFDVVTYEVLAPTCGQVQCHSATTKVKGWALDTLDGARAAMPELLGPGRNSPSQLTYVITTTGGDRMPPDDPLGKEDVDLVQAWIDAGTPGL